MFDIIGDIHGYGDELKRLLLQLGYKKKGNNFSHPSRKVCFLGDFIDRGEEVLEVLSIVREMIAEGNAYSIMGNHEYNYLAYHLYSQRDNNYCRPHNKQNDRQIAKTLSAFRHLTAARREEWREWFLSLPLYLEFENFRLVHAFWDHSAIEALKQSPFIDKGCYLTEEAILRSSHFVEKHLSPEKRAIEMLLKGPEYPFEKEFNFYDPEKNLREYARVFWWKVPPPSSVKTPSEDIAGLTLYDVLHLPKETKYARAFGLPLPPAPDELPCYLPNEKVLFFGHYWLRAKDEMPEILLPNATCLDYSVARKGHLAAYRYDSDTYLTAEKMMLVPSRE